jgi:hypothetical protein
MGPIRSSRKPKQKPFARPTAPHQKRQPRREMKNTKHLNLDAIENLPK